MARTALISFLSMITAPVHHAKGRQPRPATNSLALEISERWDRVWPYTNNAAERAIASI